MASMRESKVRVSPKLHGHAAKRIPARYLTRAYRTRRCGASCPALRRDGAVDVIDSGPGLTAEDAAKLFERGYRGAHAEHTHGGGIGLSIVRRLCDLYGWNVRVVPGEERGVIATLSFQ